MSWGKELEVEAQPGKIHIWNLTDIVGAPIMESLCCDSEDRPYQGPAPLFSPAAV